MDGETEAHQGSQLLRAIQAAKGHAGIQWPPEASALFEEPALDPPLSP